MWSSLVDTLDKPGVKGRVIAINLLFTTLMELPEAGGALVQVPNSQFFQKSVRRWRGAEVQAMHKDPTVEAD